MRASGAKPKIGITYRTVAEEAAGKRDEPCIRAIEAAGGDAVVLSLAIPQKQLAEAAALLDAFVLPGSPADVDPEWYHVPREPACHDADPAREQADFTLLDVALAAGKPVLAICYGMQSLNVYLGGTLFQDIATGIETNIQHDWPDHAHGAPGRPDENGEPFHTLRIEPGTLLARLAAANASLAGAAEARVNSSHHQSVQRLGRDLRIAATSPDGVIEAVEWTGGPGWVLGVEWHPERMPGQPMGTELFHALVAAVHGVSTVRVQ